jgi:hypothetical protein
MFQLDTPVAFVIFNRPDTTAKVFARIRDARPSKLYVISDAPRDSYPGDAALVKQSQKLVEDGVDWPCQVHTNYAGKNMGCRDRPASGIAWVLENEEYAIILEDDCVPEPCFFQYCQELLIKYRNDKRIMMISGTNTVLNAYTGDSILFSAFSYTWGWATWRRAWNLYDIQIKSWAEHKKRKTLKPRFRWYTYAAMKRNLDRVANSGFDAWDFQWMYCMHIHEGLGIVPQKNLVANIGFSKAATHTVVKPAWLNEETSELCFPLKLPKHVVRNDAYDKAFEKYMFGSIRNKVGLLFSPAFKQFVRRALKHG